MPVEAPAGNGTIGAVAPPATRRALIPTPQRGELRNTNEIVILSDAGWIQDYLFWGMTMTPGGYTHHQHFHSGRSNCPLISTPSKSQSPDCTTSLPVPVTEACKVRRAVLTTRRQIMCRNCVQNLLVSATNLRLARIVLNDGYQRQLSKTA